MQAYVIVCRDTLHHALCAFAIHACHFGAGDTVSKDPPTLYFSHIYRWVGRGCFAMLYVASSPALRRIAHPVLGVAATTAYSFAAQLALRSVGLPIWWTLGLIMASSILCTHAPSFLWAYFGHVHATGKICWPSALQGPRVYQARPICNGCIVQFTLTLENFNAFHAGMKAKRRGRRRSRPRHSERTYIKPIFASSCNAFCKMVPRAKHTARDKCEQPASVPSPGGHSFCRPFHVCREGEED